MNDLLYLILVLGLSSGLFLLMSACSLILLKRNGLYVSMNISTLSSSGFDDEDDDDNDDWGCPQGLHPSEFERN